MNKNIYLISFFFLVVYSVLGQVSVLEPEQAGQATRKAVGASSASIKPEELREHVEVLASDSMEGRETGHAGQKKAAEYIRDQFRAAGLQPVITGDSASYFQPFELARERWGEVWLGFNGQNFRHGSEIVYHGEVEGVVEDTFRVAFAGNGNEQGFRPYTEQKKDIKGVAFLQDADNPDWRSRAIRAAKRGFRYIFIILTDTSLFKSRMEVFRDLNNTAYYLPSEIREAAGQVFFIDTGISEALFDVPFSALERAAARADRGRSRRLKKLNSISVHFHAEKQEVVTLTENVMAYLPGREHPEEVLVVSAHYDHLGLRDGAIYYGADDNASGTAALMELGEAFTGLKDAGEGPARSILFIAFTGEEKGLLGSGYYVDHPAFPLDKTVANFNIDMIGRIDGNHRGDSAYVYLIGSDKLSQDLHQISETMNATYTGLMLDYTYNDDQDPNRYYYRSDQYSFARKNIPSIFYFTGVHEDYHRPTDTADKLAYDRMATITRLIFFTVMEVADREDRIGYK